MARDKIEVHITAENEQFVSKLQETVRFINNAEREAKKSSSVMNKSFSGGFVAGVSNATVALGGLYFALSGIKDIAASIVMPGFELAKSLETAQLGIAGILTSMTTVNGEALKFSDAMGISSKIMQKIQQDALRTSASVGELTNTFRAILAPGIGAGMNIDEIERFAVVGVNAVKAIGLDSTQFVQELRDLVQGGIQASSSTLATSLGLTDADIKAAKESSEGLFKFLMERMEGFAPMAEAFPDTLTGKISMLKETSTYASKEITDAFESEIVNVLTDITELIADVDTKTGEMHINPEILEFIDEMRADWYKLCAFLDDVMPRQSTQFEDTVWVLRDLWDITKNVTSGLTDFLRVLANSDIVKYFIRGLRLLTNELNYLSDTFAKFYDKRAKSMGYKSNSAEAMKVIADEQNQLRRTKRNASSGIDANDLQAKFDNKAVQEAEKAYKKLVAESQKALKRMQADHKSFLDDQLAILKDKLEDIDVQFQQDNISIDDYYNEKMANEIQQEQLTINRIIADIASAQEAAYNTADERDDALKKLNVELAENQRKIGRLLDAQKDVADVMRSFGNQNKQFNKQNAGGQLQNPQAVLGDYAGDILKFGNQYGVNPALIWSVMKNESSFNPNAASEAGAQGLMQLMPATAAELGFTDLYDSAKNIEAGTKYLAELLQTFDGDVEKAIAAYNAGPGAVQQYEGIPPYAETQAYVKKVFDDYQNKFGEINAAMNNIIAKPEGSSWRREVNNVDIEGLNQAALDGISAISQKFQELTGRQMIVSSGKRNWGGHVNGNKFDVVDDADTTILEKNKNGIRDAIIEYAQNIGLKVLDEYANPSANATAGHLDFEATGFSLSGLNSFASINANSKQGLEYKKALEQRQKEIAATNRSYNGLFGDISSQQKIDKILEYRDKIKKALVNNDQAGADRLKILLEKELQDTDAKQYEQAMELNLQGIQDSHENMINSILAGDYTVKEAIDRYTSYFNDNGVYMVGGYIKSLEEIAKDYENKGFRSAAVEIRAKITSAKNSLKKMVDDFVDTIKDTANWKTNMVDSNFWYTSGQKENAKKQIESERIQAENTIYIERLTDAYNRYNEAVKNGDTKNAAIIKGEIVPLERMIEYNKQLAYTPTLMEKVQQSSKQALEDGLNTFLTDGITQAESLADALNELLTTVLKAIQKEFANSITADLMNKWYKPEPEKEKDAAAADVTDIEDTATIETNFNNIVSDFGSFNLQFSEATGNFVVQLQGAFQQILQSIQSATNMIPSFDGASGGGTGGNFDFGSGNVWDTLPAHADGGLIEGAGTGTSDSILSRLSNGEFVIKAAAVKKYGTAALERINNGTFMNFRVNVPKFAKGGLVGAAGSGVGEGMANFAAMIGTEVNPNIRISNYVDGKRIFDEYGAPLVRNITKQEVANNSKLYSELFKRRK